MENFAGRAVCSQPADVSLMSVKGGMQQALPPIPPGIPFPPCQLWEGVHSPHSSQPGAHGELFQSHVFRAAPALALPAESALSSSVSRGFSMDSCLGGIPGEHSQMGDH